MRWATPTSSSRSRTSRRSSAARRSACARRNSGTTCNCALPTPTPSARDSGPITGGLIEYAPTSYFYLDHDQRNGFSAVLSLKLPRRFWATPSVNFGSGFVNGDGPAHLPPHTTADLALGKDFGENWSFSLNGTNVLNSRYLHGYQQHLRGHPHREPAADLL